jgi:hypothetical protein
MSCYTNITENTKVDEIIDRLDNTLKNQKEILLSNLVSSYINSKKSTEGQNIYNSVRSNIDCLINELFIMENVLGLKNEKLKQLLDKKTEKQNYTSEILMNNQNKYITELDDKNASIPRYYNTELLISNKKTEIITKLLVIIFFVYIIWKKIRNS